MVRQFKYELKISGSTEDGDVRYHVLGEAGVDDSLLKEGAMLRLGIASDLNIILPLHKMNKDAS